MENFNQSPLIEKLSVGPEWVEYLLANGWNIINIVVCNDFDSITFENDKAEIHYHCNDQHSRFTHKVKWSGRKIDGNSISGFDLEADLLRFAFLCHSLGWVKLEDANLTCKNSTGTSLFSCFKQSFDMKFEAKQIANEMFIAA